MTPTDFSPSFEVTGVNTMDWPRYFSPSTAMESGADAKSPVAQGPNA